MERLPMCRICLADKVRLCIVANRNLHKLYEKLTDIPFETEDSRPILACVFCCAQLKQCYRLLRQCLKAENFFAQRMNDKSEPNSLINENRFVVFGGRNKPPVNFVGHIAVEEDLSAVCDGPDDVIEPKEEYQSDELQPENSDKSCLDAAGVPPHYYESDLEDDVPLMNCKTEVEDEEVSKCNTHTIKLEPENSDTNCLDAADIPPHCYESDLEDNVPLINCKIEVEDEEVSKKKSSTQTIKLEPGKSDNSCPAGIPQHCYQSDLEDDVPLINCKIEVEDEEMSKNIRNTEAIKATFLRNSKQDTRRTIEKDLITAKQATKDKSDPKVIRTVGKWTFKPGSYFKETNTRNRFNSNKVKKEYNCDVCQRNFISKSKIIAHIRVHTGKKPYKCNICQRNFSQKSHLTMHMRTHTGEKPHKCNVCECCFSRKGDVKIHMRTHTGEKPYECNFCQRNFSQKGHLTHHMLTHTGEKPHKCSVCQFCFGRKSDLTVHMRSHNDEKPHKCNVCQCCFSRKNDLKIHMRTHTGEKPYECNVCQRNFRQKTTLRRHMRTHTGEKSYKRHLSAQLDEKGN